MTQLSHRFLWEPQSLKDSLKRQINYGCFDLCRWFSSLCWHFTSIHSHFITLWTLYGAVFVGLQSHSLSFFLSLLAVMFVSLWLFFIEVIFLFTCLSEGWCVSSWACAHLACIFISDNSYTHAGYSATIFQTKFNKLQSAASKNGQTALIPTRSLSVSMKHLRSPQIQENMLQMFKTPCTNCYCFRTCIHE